MVLTAFRRGEITAVSPVVSVLDSSESPQYLEYFVFLPILFYYLQTNAVGGRSGCRLRLPPYGGWWTLCACFLCCGLRSNTTLLLFPFVPFTSFTPFLDFESAGAPLLMPSILETPSKRESENIYAAVLMSKNRKT